MKRPIILLLAAALVLCACGAPAQSSSVVPESSSTASVPQPAASEGSSATSAPQPAASEGSSAASEPQPTASESSSSASEPQPAVSESNSAAPDPQPAEPGDYIPHAVLGDLQQTLEHFYVYNNDDWLGAALAKRRARALPACAPCADDALLGDPFAPLDLLEMTLRDDTKLLLTPHQNGFVLAGTDAEARGITGSYLAQDAAAWQDWLAALAADYQSARKFPSWLGIINYQKLQYISYADLKSGEVSTAYREDDIAGQGQLRNVYLSALRDIHVQGPGEKIPVSTPSDPLTEVRIDVFFVNDILYQITYQPDALLIYSSDMGYGLRYRPVESCDIYTLFHPNPSTDKPVIYLYPTQETEVSVQLEFDGALTYTYPTYDEGWCVLAQPDGTLLNCIDGSTHYYLFWEGVAAKPWQIAQGFVVKGSETEAFLRKSLIQLGLTPREYNDFLVYWVPRMQQNPYNLISFSGAEYEAVAQLIITPSPQSILRVHMLWQPLQAPVSIAPQTLPAPFVRKGFTVVEWGGTELPG